MASEKELNAYLFDQLAMLDRLQEIAEEEGATKILDAIERERNWVNKKLYQNPSLEQKQ